MTSTESQALHSPRMEKVVLSTLVYTPELIAECGDRLADELFFEPSIRTIWRHAKAIHAKGGKPDFILLHERLAKEGTLDGVGGTAILSELTSGQWAQPAGIAYYLNELEGYAKQRAMISETEAIASLARSGETKESELRAKAMIAQLRQDKANGTTRLTKEVMADVIDELELSHNNKGVSPYPSLGLQQLDNAIGGIVPGHVVVLGAKTNHGKSSFALHWVRQASKAHSRSIIFSCEMAPRRLMQRMIAAESGVPLSAMRLGTMTEEQFGKVSEAMAAFPPDRIIFVDDAGSMHAGRMVDEVRKARDKYPDLSLVIVDYIQQVTAPPETEKGANREQQVAAVSRTFQTLAQALDVTVLILSQLNEQGSVRDSRTIGFDADVVLTLTLEDPTPGITQRAALLSVDKNRDGESGQIIKLSFNGTLQRFHAMEDK